MGALKMVLWKRLEIFIICRYTEQPQSHSTRMKLKKKKKKKKKKKNKKKKKKNEKKTENRWWKAQSTLLSM